MQQKIKQRIALNALFFQSGLCFSTWASRIPDIKDSFHLSDSTLGIILLIRPLGALIGLPLAGWLVDKAGSKKSAIGSTILFSSSLLLLGFSSSVPFLAVSLLIFGIGANLVSISNNAQALLVQKSYGKIIIASFHGLWSLAGFCGAGIGALMISLKLDTSLHFMIIFGIILVILLLSFSHLNPESETVAGRKIIFKRPDQHLTILGTIAFCGLMCEGCMFDWSGVYFKQVINAEEGMIASGYMAFMGMMALGRLISDTFSNKFGSRLIIQISGGFIFSGLLTAVLFPSLPTAILGFLLVGMGTASTMPLTYNEVGKNKHFSPGIALAMVTTIGYFGFLLGPPVIGFIADLLSLRASFLLVAFVGLTITLITTLQKNTIRDAD